jgi:heme/copper-type cytochrome/quinol oxidase subunit 2
MVRRCLALASTMATSTFLLSDCSTLSRGFLAPAGPIAAAERHEFFVVGGILLLVIGPVMLLTPLIAWHYRLSNSKHAYRPQWGFSWILEALIWIPPTMIVIALSVLLWKNTEAPRSLPAHFVTLASAAGAGRVIGLEMAVHLPGAAYCLCQPIDPACRSAGALQPYQRDRDAVVAHAEAGRTDLRNGGDDHAVKPRCISARDLLGREYTVQRNGF